MALPNGEKGDQSRLLVFAPPATYTTQWCDHFAARGWSVDLVSYGFRDPAAVAFVPEILGRFPWITAARLERERRRFRRIVERVRPDVVHAHWITGPAWIAALAGGAPLVATAWGSDALLHGRDSSLARWLAPRLARAATAVTYDSESIADALVETGLPRERLVRIVFGADPLLFRPCPADRAVLRKLGIANDDPVFVSPRGISDVYEPETIVRGFAYACQRRPSNLLVRVAHVHLGDDAVAGEQSRRWAEMQALAAELEVSNRIVAYHGVEREALPLLFSSCAAVISVPYSDGTSVALLEALFCEAPVVVSELPANREWIPDEAHGRVVRVGDHEALGEALVSVLENYEDSRDRARRAGKRARERGSRPAEFAKVEALYRSMASTRVSTAAQDHSGQAAIRRDVGPSR